MNGRMLSWKIRLCRTKILNEKQRKLLLLLFVYFFLHQHHNIMEFQQCVYFNVTFSFRCQLFYDNNSVTTMYIHIEIRPKLIGFLMILARYFIKVIVTK